MLASSCWNRSPQDSKAALALTGMGCPALCGSRTDRGPIVSKLGRNGSVNQFGRKQENGGDINHSPSST